MSGTGQLPGSPAPLATPAPAPAPAPAPGGLQYGAYSGATGAPNVTPTSPKPPPRSLLQQLRSSSPHAGAGFVVGNQRSRSGSLASSVRQHFGGVGSGGGGGGSSNRPPSSPSTRSNHNFQSARSITGAIDAQPLSAFTRAYAYGFYNAGLNHAPRPKPVLRVPNNNAVELPAEVVAYEPVPLPKMPLGILNTKNGAAPGTVAVMADERKNSNGMSPDQANAIGGHELDMSLKYDRGGQKPILLVPQPTDDPNDPLNWPRWRRDVILIILCLMSVIASTLSPLLAADTFSLAIDFERNFTDMALITGYHLLAVGVSGFLFVATARVWGKRHLYLLGCLLIIVASAWGGATGLNYKSLLAARIVQGIGLAPFEALVNASVGDLFFVHERGSRMALSNMALFGGAFFTPIIVGKMSYTIGWQWSFYFIAIFAGLLFPFIFFFVPETTYPRPENNLGNDVDTLGNPIGMSTAAVTDDKFPAEAAATETTPTQPPPARMSYWRQLLPFNGRKTKDPFFKLVLRPLPLFFHPAVAWACLIQGALIGWTVLIGVVLAAIFLGPPLWFGEVQTGYMYAGPFLGALAGFLLSGFLADWSTRLLIRANGGVYEPEFRILLVTLQLVLGCLGLFGFGWQSSKTDHGWFLPDLFFAFEVAGMVVGAVASALYIVDAHREIAVEAFTCLLIFKNVFSFGLTYGAFDWLSSTGIFDTFMIIGGVQVGICLLSVPMYIFGKRNRAFFAGNKFLKMIGLW